MSYFCKVICCGVVWAIPGGVSCYCAIRTLSSSDAVQELIREVSLVAVSCNVICSGNVGCDGTIWKDEYGTRYRPGNSQPGGVICWSGSYTFNGCLSGLLAG